MKLSVRQHSRICAMQMLYSRQAGGEDTEGTQLMSEEFLTVSELEDAYIEQTLSGVREHEQEIDDKINAYAQGWKAERLPKVDLAILRLGIFEILYRDDIPDGATINECVEMAKKYSNPESGSYINGILSSCERDKLGESDPRQTAEE